METVLQKYLRRDFATIREYNSSAQEVAEPFRFLVIFDFPDNFSETAFRRLTSILRNGPRCGVYTFLTVDAAEALPYGVSLDEIEALSTVIDWRGGKGTPTWRSREFSNVALRADSAAGHQEVVRRIVQRSGATAVTAMKVEVPFDQLVARSGLDCCQWTESAASSLRVPLGPSGARKLQFLTMGEGLAHHALVVGRTGSGKTNLLHVIITGLALRYSPQELHLYLIDFKGGVGFKPYASHRLPHARVIAIESEREFGMSVLNGLDQELKRRFELFRTAGVANLNDFRAKTNAILPRIVLVVDEFQEFFAYDDLIAQQARTIFERLAREGRSFGLHILLGTQSLSGSAQLPTAILSQMAIRIALPCGESDSRMIFSDENLASRSLSRPGEGIYNPAAGAVEGNNPFQVALLSDRDLESHLARIGRREVGTAPLHGAVVFEGNEPASLEASDVWVERQGMPGWPTTKGGACAWLGEPVALLPSVACTFTRQAGRHLLVVEREEHIGVGVLSAALLALFAHHPPTHARFWLLDHTAPDAPGFAFLPTVQELFPHQAELLNRRSLRSALEMLAKTIDERLDLPHAHDPPHYLVISGLHRARNLRRTDDFGFLAKSEETPLPDLLATILRDGPEAGVHVLAWCDTVPNARRTLDRAIADFAFRVAGSMSMDDSQAFIDGPDASRLDRPHRMIFSDESRPGMLQKFRPFAQPRMDWVRAVANRQRAWSST